MLLFLNTAEFEKLHFALIGDAKDTKVLAEKKIKISHPETEKALAYLDSFLRAAKVKPTQLTAVYVVSGPGSFTGIRAGVAHALAFSEVLKIPVYSLTVDQIPKQLSLLPQLKLKKFGATIEPAYGREPNITM